jgi:hypothetical protein
MAIRTTAVRAVRTMAETILRGRQSQAVAWHKSVPSVTHPAERRPCARAHRRHDFIQRRNVDDNVFGGVHCCKRSLLRSVGRVAHLRAIGCEWAENSARQETQIERYERSPTLARLNSAADRMAIRGSATEMSELAQVLIFNDFAFSHCLRHRNRGAFFRSSASVDPLLVRFRSMSCAV